MSVLNPRRRDMVKITLVSTNQRLTAQFHGVPRAGEFVTVVEDGIETRFFVESVNHNVGPANTGIDANVRAIK